MGARHRHRLEPYLQRLFGYAYSLVHSADAAEDLVQNAMVKALAARSVPHDEPAYRAWLFRILRNAYVDDARRKANRDQIISPGHLEEETGGQYGSEMQEVNALAVRIAFAELPVIHREIIGAIDIAGLSYAEAAVLLDVPEGTIMSRISRARSVLYKGVTATESDEKLGFFPTQKRKATGSGE